MVPGRNDRPHPLVRVLRIGQHICRHRHRRQRLEHRRLVQAQAEGGHVRLPARTGGHKPLRPGKKNIF